MSTIEPQFDYCYIGGQLRGDIVYAKVMLVDVMGVVTLNEHGRHEWTEKNALVIFGGNIMGQYEHGNRHMAETTVKDSFKELENLIVYLQAMQVQALARNSRLIIMAGEHELGHWQMEEKYLKYVFPEIYFDDGVFGKPTANSITEDYFYEIVEKYKDFFASMKVMIMFGRLFVTHGTIRHEWFKKNNISSIKHINDLWRQGINKGGGIHLDLFSQKDSPLFGQESVIRTQEWLDKTNTFLGDTFLNATNATTHYIISTNTPVQDVLNVGYHFKPMEDSNIWEQTTLDTRMKVFMVENKASSTFCMIKQSEDERGTRIPQALGMKIYTDKDILGSKNFIGQPDYCYTKFKPFTLQGKALKDYQEFNYACIL